MLFFCPYFAQTVLILKVLKVFIDPMILYNNRGLDQGHLHVSRKTCLVILEGVVSKSKSSWNLYTQIPLCPMSRHDSLEGMSIIIVSSQLVITLLFFN